jgi:hypothetical protein
MKKITSARIYKKYPVIIAIAISGSIFSPTQAQTENTTMASHENDTAVSQSQDTLAIQGYDPVAYFKYLKAIKGSDEFSHEWMGDKWLFANAKHKKLFVDDTLRYMPNYGGYCSFDPVSLGHGHDIDPTAWRIVNEKLYLFYSDVTAGQKMHADEWNQVKAGLAQQ